LFSSVLGTVMIACGDGDQADPAMAGDDEVLHRVARCIFAKVLAGEPRKGSG